MPILETVTRRIRTSGPNPARAKGSGISRAWGSLAVAGTPVNDGSAVALPTFYGGVALIARSVAAFPMHVYRDLPDGQGKAISQSAGNSYIWRRPNGEEIQQVMWERVVADVVRGNGFIWVEKLPTGRPAGIWWIARNRVRVGRTAEGQKVYQIDNELPMIDYRDGGEIIHIPNWGDSMLGYDIVKIAAQAISLGLSAQDYASRTFTQGDVPPGIITTEQALTPEQAEAVAESWHRQHAGMINVGRTAVIGNGGRFQQTMIDLEKMQMEALRRFQAIDIATLLGLPSSMLNQTSGAWHITAEQNQQLVTYSLGHYINRIEQSVDDALLTTELTGEYLKLETSYILRGTPLQRGQFYALGYGRWFTPNDIRRLEDMPPVEGGDSLLAAVNMAPLEEIVAASSLGEQEAEPADV